MRIRNELTASSALPKNTKVAVRQERIVDLKGGPYIRGLPRGIEILMWTRGQDARLRVPHGITIVPSGILVRGEEYGWTNKNVRSVTANGVCVWPPK